MGGLRRIVALLAVAGLAVAMTGCSTATGRPSSAASGQPAFAIDRDFPDPDVMRAGDDYFAYATNTPAVNVQWATSKNLATWTVSHTDALPTLPSWSLPGKTWAPDVSKLGDGGYVMYFVAANAEPALQCIGVATSTSPEGPFTPVGAAPLLCPPEEGGAIDPSTFTDTDGTRYLLWKNDGNCCGLDTWVQIAPLSADGTRLTGPSQQLIKQTESWEGTLVEAPTLIRHGDRYVLFYSANDYSGGKYAIGYATADSISGPYTKHDGPLFSTTLSHNRYTGPGGQDVVVAPDGSDRLVFHSWDPALAYRGMNVLPLRWHGDAPVVGR